MALRYLNSQRAPSIYHNILSILFIHVSKSITIMITIKIKIEAWPIYPSVSSGFSVVINL